jgi:hypothetical protein
VNRDTVYRKVTPTYAEHVERAVRERHSTQISLLNVQLHDPEQIFKARMRAEGGSK